MDIVFSYSVCVGVGVCVWVWVGGGLGMRVMTAMMKAMKTVNSAQ
jgi:hypothetical protein